MRVLAECQAHCSFGRAYVGLLTDLPHVAFEGTLTIVQDILLGLLLWPRIKPWVLRRVTRQVHAQIDAEHGITHETEGPSS